MSSHAKSESGPTEEEATSSINAMHISDRGAGASHSQAARTSLPPAREDEDDVGEPDPAALQRFTNKRGPRRGAVSAEVYSEEDIANYVKKVSRCLFIVCFGFECGCSAGFWLLSEACV